MASRNRLNTIHTGFLALISVWRNPPVIATRCYIELVLYDTWHLRFFTPQCFRMLYEPDSIWLQQEQEDTVSVCLAY